MVSAVIARAGNTGVVIVGPEGNQLGARRADLSDDTDPHGVNRDEADDLAEAMGWIVGTWRWQAEGYYKAVATPDRAKMTDREAADWQGRENQRQEARRRASGNPAINPGTRPASYGKRS